MASVTGSAQFVTDVTELILRRRQRELRRGRTKLYFVQGVQGT